MNISEAIETPSGKSAGDENFPVGSWLLPAHLRPHVAVFYRFARAIDDIADNPDLSPEDKIERLSRFEAALSGAETGNPALATAQRMRDSLEETGVEARHCLDLIAAFKQDAVKSRYDDWAELLGYCKMSANPVGRYLLDLHGESASGYPFSDALCSALQVLNHLQDCQDDYLTMDRVYLPLPWLKSSGVDVRVLQRRFATPGLRRVLNLCLDEVDDLLIMARLLPERLSSRSLAMESAVILRLARRLSERLRESDPLAARVSLSRLDFVSCGLRGIGAVWRERPRSGSGPVKTARLGR